MGVFSLGPLTEATTLVLLLFVATLLLHLILPARRVIGYCCDQWGNPLEYRLNGLYVYICTAAIFMYLPSVWQQSLFLNYSEAVRAANATGFVASVYFFMRGGKERYERCLTVDQLEKHKRGALPIDKTEPDTAARFWFGHEFNPRIGQLDVKMWLYVVGAVVLQCNILSYLAVERERLDGGLSLASGVYASLFAWFLIEYLCGESVHLYTYDLFAEKLGCKLIWGCLCFYPFFYPIGLFALANRDFKASSPQDLTALEAFATVAIFFTGWCITRGANMQKFAFRTRPREKAFLCGLVRQEAVPGTRILVSGWWGVARHFNYLGEILQAVALSLPGCIVSQSLFPKLLCCAYPMYYVFLFVSRQKDDDCVCKAKYGKKWDEYIEKVPYRIVPWLY